MALPPRSRHRDGDDPSYWSRLYSLEVKPEHIQGIDGLVVLRPWVKRSTFAEGAGDLVVIGRSGAGYDKIDLEACTEHGVAVFNAPMALNHPTASSALLFMLALAKRLFEQDRITRQGRWDLQAVGDGRRDPRPDAGDHRPGPHGTRAGSAGRPVRDAGPRVFAARRSRPWPRSLGVRLTSLDEVLRESDFLSLHCRLTDATRGLIGAGELALMKPTAYFINVGRGELVDQPPLTEALRDRRIAGAALDVFASRAPPPGRSAARRWTT